MKRRTPGPWRAKNSCVINESGEIVACFAVGGVVRGDDAEDHATAHLVAAAPELLVVALKTALNLRSAGFEPVEGSNHPLESLLYLAEAAIAKSEGKS